MGLQPHDRKYVFILVASLVLAVAAEWLAPEPVDWSWSLERRDTRPYGATIAFDVLPDLFPGAAVEPRRVPPYLVLRDTSVTDVNYLFLSQTFAPDVAEAQKLIAFVKRGNALFVSAAAVRGRLADSLHLSVEAAGPIGAPQPPGSIRDSLGVNFVNPDLRADTAWTFQRGAVSRYVAAFDTSRTTVLGVDTEGRVNYVRIGVGAGQIFVHLVPLAFTNYHMLEPRGLEYAMRALSYLPVRTTWWDAHYKPGRSEANTPLRFVLSDPSLRWAYYLLLGGVVLFIVVEAKRRQRIIPVIEPPRNASLDFVRTIGRLYFQHGDHAALARNRISFFLEYIRSHLNLPTHTLDDDLAARIAERSGVDREDVQRLFQRVREVRDREMLTESELHALNRQIESFYAHSQR